MDTDLICKNPVCYGLLIKTNKAHGYYTFFGNESQPEI